MERFGAKKISHRLKFQNPAEPIPDIRHWYSSLGIAAAQERTSETAVGFLAPITMAF